MKMKIKTKMKNKKQNENKNRDENKNEFLFSFCLSFLLLFEFLLSKGFCIFVKSTQPGGARDGQLFFIWSRRIFVCEFSTWSSGAVGGQPSFDWPRSAVAPRNMAPCLIRICVIQWCCSLFSFSTGNTLFGQISSKKLKLSV